MKHLTLILTLILLCLATDTSAQNWAGVKAKTQAKTTTKKTSNWYDNTPQTTKKAAKTQKKTVKISKKTDTGADTDTYTKDVEEDFIPATSTETVPVANEPVKEIQPIEEARALEPVGTQAVEPVEQIQAVEPVQPVEEVKPVEETQFSNVTAQQTPRQLTVVQVEQLEKSTLLYMQYVADDIDSILGIGNININDGTCLISHSGSRRYRLINSLNLPVESEAEYKSMIIDHKGQQHNFILEFEKISLDDDFDMIEKEGNQNAFNLYGIHVNPNNYQPFVSMVDFISGYPVKEYGRYIKDDKNIYYVQANGIVLTIGVQGMKQYGKYYCVNMDLQNYSGKSILFSLNNIKSDGIVIKEKKGIKNYNILPMDVLTATEYDRKVKSRQAWNNFFVALGEGLAAASAGYSSSTTTYSGSSSTHSSATAYGFTGDSYIYAHGYGSSYTTSYGQSHTTSYNGAAAYWANQQAAANTAAFAAQQESIRDRLNDGYVKTNTIQNLIDYSGYFNIKYKKVDGLKIIFTIGGTEFPFVL